MAERRDSITRSPSQEVDAAVNTVTAHDAVTTNQENIIIANLNGKYRRFDKIEHVPPGCRTYTSKIELKGQLKKQLETIYGYVKGAEKSFKDHNAAVEGVWLAFSQLPVFDPVRDDPEGQERAKKKVSLALDPEKEKDKKSYQKKREESKYVIKPETEKSKKLIAALAPQAKACVDIIRKDGKPQYSEGELRALIAENAEKLRTRQESWRIFQYYRGKLIAADVLVQQ